MGNNPSVDQMNPSKQQHSGPLNKIELQKQWKQNAYEQVHRAIDFDNAGKFNEAIKLYEQGAEELRKVLRIEFSPMEWEHAKETHFRIKNTLAKVEERLQILTKNRTHSMPNVFSSRPSSNLAQSSEKPLHQSADVQRRLASSSEKPLKSARTQTTPSKANINSANPLQGVDSKLANLILNELVEKTDGLSLKDVVGLENAKQALIESVILPIARPDIFTGLRSPLKGLLLFGPPGNGKTYIAKAIASEANAKFFGISASTLVSKWHGESEKMVKTLFAVARYVAPSVIFIDEVDAVLSERSSQEHEASRRLKTEFLVQVDGVSSSQDDRILVMGATNRPQDLDEAVLRRMAKRIYIPLPDKKGRKKLIQSLLSKSSTKYNLSNSELDQIVRWTEGYSFADLTSLCKDAALEPIRKLGMRVKNISASDVPPIVFHDFENALKNIRPSVSKQYLKMYEEWNKEHGSV